jgi:hypothetical protein
MVVMAAVVVMPELPVVVRMVRVRPAPMAAGTAWPALPVVMVVMAGTAVPRVWAVWLSAVLRASVVRRARPPVVVTGVPAAAAVTV